MISIQRAQQPIRSATTPEEKIKSQVSEIVQGIVSNISSNTTERLHGKAQWGRLKSGLCHYGQWRALQRELKRVAAHTSGRELDALCSEFDKREINWEATKKEDFNYKLLLACGQGLISDEAVGTIYNRINLEKHLPASGITEVHALLENGDPNPAFLRLLPSTIDGKQKTFIEKVQELPLLQQRIFTYETEPDSSPADFNQQLQVNYIQWLLDGDLSRCNAYFPAFQASVRAASKRPIRKLLPDDVIFNLNRDRELLPTVGLANALLREQNEDGVQQRTRLSAGSIANQLQILDSRFSDAMVHPPFGDPTQNREADNYSVEKLPDYWTHDGYHAATKNQFTQKQIKYVYFIAQEFKKRYPDDPQIDPLILSLLDMNLPRMSSSQLDRVVNLTARIAMGKEQARLLALEESTEPVDAIVNKQYAAIHAGNRVYDLFQIKQNIPKEIDLFERVYF